MKIVIDIPECFYEYCKAQEDAVEVQLAIKNGTPLPKGAEILTKEAYSDLCLRASNERKTGKWIPVTNGRGGSECNQCHSYAPSYQSGVENKSNYCPHCGATMEGVEE